ncbi:NAD(P)-dependent oxidoreductase [Phytoactinopolyspora limicola]|uniref:NAD(P)-dependent oxidoreductase n=1 Tax=Phytoactinopolyspora limicola TaxID=2715536 RepID=UPI00140B04EF|nr:NAD(P)H-binding protein [Phytoactinopolyspora limicola]
MRITVFGAAGRTGRLVAADGIRRGHEITACTRRPDALDDLSGLARVVSGDGRDPTVVETAVTGADAVISIVSPPGRKGPHHTAAVAETVTSVMKAQGVGRLVVTSAYPRVADRPRLLVAVLRRILADSYADDAAMEEIVRSSDLDWTIVRLNMLTDKPATGRLHTSRDLLSKPRSMTRADAAILLLDVIEDPAATQTAVNATGMR